MSQANGDEGSWKDTYVQKILLSIKNSAAPPQVRFLKPAKKRQHDGCQHKKLHDSYIINNMLTI
jgi:hypothetical protein